MVSPSLQEYVADCARQSCVISDVRATLLASGWPESEVEEALVGYGQAAPVSSSPVASLAVDPIQQPAAPAQPELAHLPEEPVAAPAVRPSGRGRRIALATAATLGGLLVVAGVPTAFAEQGYLPAFSKAYRSLNLAVAWNGLAGTPSLALGQAVKAASQVSVGSVTSQNSITISEIGQSADANEVNAILQKGLAFMKVPGSSDTISFADVSADGAVAVTAPSIDYSTFLPITLSGTTTAVSDASGRSESTFSLDLTSLLTKVPLISQLLPGTPSVATGDIISDPVGKKIYLKSNVFPYKKASDKLLWASTALPTGATSDASDDQSVQDVAKSLTSDQLRDLGQIVNGLVTDEGVERLDDKPAAHYQAAITLAKLRSLQQQYPDNQYLKQMDLSSLQGDGSLTIDLWIGEFDHLPYRVKVVDSGPLGVGTAQTQIGIKISSDNTFAYSGIQPVTVPDSSSVIPEDALQYFSEAYQQEHSGTATLGN